MARPRSEDKRQAILLAAIQLFAAEGLSAPTARIARAAGVAEGTLFTYFASKDELMNQLYLHLKDQLHGALTPPSSAAGMREQIWMAWRTYVDWGLDHEQERQVLGMLSMSNRVADSTKAQGREAFCDVSRLLSEAMAKGALKSQPGAFVESLMGAMAEATVAFVRSNPADAAAVREAGFTAFWNAITQG